MDERGIKQVVADVFGRNLKTEIINGWVSIQCPLSRWTHSTGRDTRASAGISIKPTDVSVFNCFTCGNKMPIHGLLRKYSKFTGENLDDLIEELEEQAYLGPRQLPEWDELKATANEVQHPLSKAVYLDLYDSAAGHPYLKERGISKAIAKKLQLMVDPCDPSDGEERILFPVFGLDGELYGLSGRATNKKARLKVRDYHGFRKALNLLGVHLIPEVKPDKIIVVEGLVDYASGWECGQPTVAVMHSTMTEAQASILRELNLPTYLFYDDDEAGDKGIRAASALLRNYVPVMKPTYPHIWVEGDPGHFVKDPGELEPAEFQEMIDGAELV